MARKGIQPRAAVKVEDETVDMIIYGAASLKAFNQREQTAISIIIYGTACGEDITGNTLKYVQTGNPDKIKSQAIFFGHNATALVLIIYCLVKSFRHTAPYYIRYWGLSTLGL
jgi:hypothetical protein